MYLSSTTIRQYILVVEVSRLVQQFFTDNVNIGLDRI